MTSKLSRRHFGRQLGLVALATALLPLGYTSTPSYGEEQQVQKVSYENSNGIEYTKIRERTATKPVLGLLDIETVKVEFGLESKLWKNLKSGMDKQEFYDAIKQAPIELKTTTIFGGVKGGRGCINSDDIKGEFFNAADKFIKNKPSQYDINLTFSKEDKAVLEKMLDRELKSSLTGTIRISSWNPFSATKQVYLYPPKSQILLRTDRQVNPEFEMLVNTNEKTYEDPVYERLDVSRITDKTEKEVFRKFLLLSILTKDPEGIVPFENFYKEYQKRKG